MNTEDLLDDVIANLKVIGMVQKNDKLCVRRGKLSLEPADNLQFVRRWILHDSRDMTMMHVKNTITSAVKIARTVMNSTDMAAEMRSWTLKSLSDEMLNCQNGLQNLKTAYLADSAVVAIIDVLISKLDVQSRAISNGNGNGNGNGNDGTNTTKPQQSGKGGPPVVQRSA